MSDPAILFVKPKAISLSDKKMLRTAGVLIVEIENPDEVKFIRAHSELSTTELLTAAAKAMTTAAFSDEVRKAFGRAVCEAVLAKATPQQDCARDSGARLMPAPNDTRPDNG